MSHAVILLFLENKNSNIIYSNIYILVY